MGKLIAVFAIVAVVGAVFFMQAKQEAAKPEKAVVSAGPPANAEYVEGSPESLLGAIASVKKPQRGAATDSVIGLWVPSAGWEGEVTDVTDRGLRIRRISSTTIGGEVSIIAYMLGRPDTEIGKTVRVQGKIKDVKSTIVPGSIVHMIELSEARLVTGG
jgi:hypothetical protein